MPWLVAIGAVASCHRAESGAAPDAAAPVETAVIAPASASAASSAAEAPDPSASPSASAVAVAPSANVDAGKVAKPPASDAGAASSVAALPSAVPDAGALPAPAAGSADAVAADVDAIYLPKKCFTARFTQEFVAQATGIKKTSKGTLTVDKPKISFKYDPPNDNRVVTDGTTIKIYDADNKQMIVRPFDKSEYPGALAFLMGQGMRSQFTFDFNNAAQFSGGPVLLGKPRVPTGFYETVLFYVDKVLLAQKSPGTIRRVVVVDAQKNKNRFDFENAAQPDSVTASEFEYAPPAGTKIVKQ